MDHTIYCGVDALFQTFFIGSRPEFCDVSLN